MSDALALQARAIIAKGSKSFAAASALFDPATRASATMLYAWCRHCDDVVDGQDLGHGQEAQDPAAQRARLATLEVRTRRALAGELQDEPVFEALRRVVAAHPMPERWPLDHLAGFGMDVEGRRFATLDDLTLYCYRVAGVVGLMMATIMGARDHDTLDRACDLGLAFQLTNIARDVVEDAGACRVYLPLDWLTQAGVPEAEVAEPRHRAALARVVARLLDEAERYYASAAWGVVRLPPRSAWAIATARAVYRDIGVRVRAEGAAAWDARVSVPKPAILAHVAAALPLSAVARLSRRTAPPREGLWTRP